MGGPEFSSDGKLPFFVSDRTFNPTYSQVEWNHIYSDMARIYFVTLAQDTKSPFAPKSDEVKVKKDEAKPETDKKGRSRESRPETEGEKKDGDASAPAKTGGVGPRRRNRSRRRTTRRWWSADADGLAQRIAVLLIPASSYGQITSVGDKLYYIRKGKLLSSTNSINKRRPSWATLALPGLS